MITDAVISAFVGALTGLLSLFPAFTISQTGYDNEPLILSVLSGLNAAVPIGAVIGAFSLVLLVVLALYAWDLVVFVYHQFWGSD